MNNHIFNSLTEEEINDGFKIVLSNANNHFVCAEILAEKKIYGIAISHLILALEESIKAIYLIRKKLFPNEEIDISGIFSKHKSKHSTAIVISDMVQKIILHYRKLLTDQILKSSEIDKKDKIFVENANKEWDDIINKIKIEKITKWWAKANGLKNDGFYVDYNNKQWQSPNDLFEKNYLESYPIAGQYLGFINLFSDLNLKNSS